MKNIAFYFLLFTLLYAPGTRAQGLVNQQSVSGSPDRIILNVTENPAHSLAVNWRSPERVEESFIQWAIAEADPRFIDKAHTKAAVREQVRAGDQQATYYSVTLDSLAPNTLYAYRVGRQEAWSEWFHMRTAAEQAEEFSFLYFGDVQTGIRDLWSRVAKEAYAQAPRAKVALYAGDLVNRANRDQEWEEWFAAGKILHTAIPTMPSPGNHDHFENEQKEIQIGTPWRPQFNLPENGPEGLEETCYFVDIQGVRFISLNSHLVEESKFWQQKQAQWLDSVLSHNPQPWTCVLFHHPIFSPKGTRDNPRMRNAFKPLFDKYKVDLVLQGHDHTYARGMEKIPMDGGLVPATMYVVSVSGPKMTGSHVEDKFWMDKSALYTQLFHVVTVSPQRLRFETRTATGELYDAFELHKQKGAANRLVSPEIQD